MARLATAEEIDVAAGVLARAFARDPVLTAFFGAGSVETAKMARYFELEFRIALAGYGEVWLDDERLGAALWRRPGGYPEPMSLQLRMVPRYLRLFPRQFFSASRSLNKLARLHPREPHWYLFAVGVVPEATGQGRGSALLEPVLERCDAERLPAYLEASSEDNARLYARLGFERRDDVEIMDGVRVRPMWREPR
ncbi:MAG TPA: GNAT family N-acetyltransferase [Gaiellaceae bacterium]|nr:GNAT family N-acetyltransferase [Gaiellaceae bacterium]